MEKKVYISTLIEVAEISINGALMVSPESPMPDPSHPGAPARRSPVF